MSRFTSLDGDFTGVQEEKSGTADRDSADFRISSRGIGLTTPIGRLGDRGDPSKNTFESIRKEIFTPIGTAFSNSSNIFANPVSLSEQPRSLTYVADEQIWGRSIASMGKVLNKGPPMLADECSLSNVLDWQRDIRNFISKIPGYKKDMLTVEPDLETMREVDKEFLAQIYTTIFSWLTLSISLNKKCMNKTRNTRIDPFPDIVGWWKNIRDVFALSNAEIEMRIIYLNSFSQFPQENCKNYFSRFDDKVQELKSLGREFESMYLGERCILGMVPENKKQCFQLLFSMKLKSTMDNVEDLCKFIDEMNVVAIPRKEEIKALVVTSNDQNRNSNISKYGPADVSQR
jgi:hypothetical protein